MGNFGINNPYSLELPFDAEKYIGNINVDELAKCAVEWIVINRNIYTKKTDIHKNLFNKLEASLSSQTMTEEYINLLRLFHESFLNNPFVYERRLTKEDKAKKICSSRIECYLVFYKEFYIPIGVLGKYIEKIPLRNLIKRFLETRMAYWKKTISEDINICGKYMGSHFAATMDESVDVAKVYYQKKWSYAIKLIVSVLIILLTVIFVIDRLVLGVDWKNIDNIIEKTNNFFQAIGFMTEKSYGINHNSWLNCAYLALSIVWTAFILCFIAPFVNCFKMYIGYARRNQLNFRAKTVERKLMALMKHCEKEIDQICSYDGAVERLAVTFRKNFGLFYMLKQLEKNGLPRNVSVKRELNINGKVPALKVLIVFLSLVLGTTYFSARSSDAEFVSKTNSYMQKLHRFIDGQKTYAKKEYVVTGNATVYAKPTKDSFALYELTPDHKYYVVPESDVENDTDQEIGAEGISENNVQKVRFYTEYGYLTGWLIDSEAKEYTPGNDESVVLLYPTAAKASRTDFGDPANVLDGNIFTAWGLKNEADFVGEYVELVLPEETAVELLMIQPGSNFFGTNTRPSEIEIEFYNENGKKSASVTLEDTIQKQYFTMNKAVKATKIRYVITNYIEGTTFNNIYITNLAVYGTKPEEE